jgi:hypothetical protein
LDGRDSTSIAQKMHCCEIVWLRTLEHFKVLAIPSIPAIIETSGVNCMQNFKHTQAGLIGICYLKMTKNKTDNSYLFNEFVCNFGFFWHEWTSLKLE